MLRKSKDSIMNKISRSIAPAIFYICIIASVMTSCIEEYNAALPSSESNLLVVEGAILSDTISTFYLSLTMPVNSAGVVKNINNATIQLKGGDGTLVDGVMTADGTYKINTPKLNENTLYKIVINYDGDTYETEEQTPFPTLAIQNVEFNQKAEDADVDILVTTKVPNDPTETQYYRWTYNETWEVRPEYMSNWIWDNDSLVAVYDPNYYPRQGWLSHTSGDIIASSSAYYSNNQIVQYKLYGIENTNHRLFVGYTTEVTQRSLRKAEYEYETERQKISKDMGGLFTPQPSSLPTNINCITSSKSVIGYVGCSLNVAHYRIFIYPDEVNVIHEYNCVTETTDGANEYSEEKKLYKKGYKLYSYTSLGGEVEEFDWTTESCVDIRTLGCDTEKPEFWKEKDE